MLSSFDGFSRARRAADGWRRTEHEIAAMRLFDWEEDIYRRALLPELTTDNEERRLYVAFKDIVQHNHNRRFVSVSRPQTPAPPFNDPDATESEHGEDDDEDAVEFVAVALGTPATPPPPATAQPAASRKRGREDDQAAPPEPIAKRTRSATRKAETIGAADHGERSGA